MKRFLSVALSVVAVLLVAGVAFAQWGGPMGGGMMTGPGMMGRGMGPGGQAGQWNCPGMAAGSQQTPAAQITEEKAKELAQQYADQYLKGFTVEKILPFTMPHGTGYSVELKGPKDERVRDIKALLGRSARGRDLRFCRKGAGVGHHLGHSLIQRG